MRDKVKILITHPLITGSTIIFIGSFIANIFNYLFNLSMGRLLPVSDYGLLTSLNSLFVMLSIFSLAFKEMFAKFSARYAARDDLNNLSHLIVKGSKYVIIISTIYIIGLIFLTGAVGRFLHVDNSFLIIIVFVAVLVSLIGAVPNGVLQGNLRFYANSFLSIFQSFLKFGSAVILVLLGYQIFGAVSAILLSGLLTTILGYFVILRYLKGSDRSKVNNLDFKKEFTHYTYTFILASIGITLLSNTDIILVRHFFNEQTSGQYAALSLMGKAIFYLIIPINFVFFPLIAQKKEKNERLFNTVVLTSGIVFAVSVAISFIYFAFPGVILQIFFPSPDYQVLKPYLGLFSLYVLLFSLVNIMNSFFLSVGKTKVYIFTLAAGILQIILIMLFHESLYQIIGALFVVNFLLLLSYFIYYMKHGKD